MVQMLSNKQLIRPQCFTLSSHPLTLLSDLFKSRHYCDDDDDDGDDNDDAVMMSHRSKFPQVLCAGMNNFQLM